MRQFELNNYCIDMSTKKELGKIYKKSAVKTRILKTNLTL